MEQLNSGELLFILRSEAPRSRNSAQSSSPIRFPQPLLLALIWCDSRSQARKHIISEETDDASLKIVVFGLSKVIGPNETSQEPFGTLSYVASEVFLQKPYGK